MVQRTLPRQAVAALLALLALPAFASEIEDDPIVEIRLSQLKEVKALADDYDILLDKHQALKVEHGDLLSDYRDLHDEYQAVVQERNRLRDQLTTEQARVKRLRTGIVIVSSTFALFLAGYVTPFLIGFFGG